jgi:TPR repeat protein
VALELGQAGQVDYRGALNWYLKAAQANYGEAMNQIGSMIERGRVHDASLGDAADWFWRAGQSGSLRGSQNWYAITHQQRQAQTGRPTWEEPLDPHYCLTTLAGGC